MIRSVTVRVVLRPGCRIWLLAFTLVLVSGCSSPRKIRDRPVTERKPFPEKVDPPRERPALPAEPMDTIRWTVIDTLKSRPPRERDIHPGKDKPVPSPPPGPAREDIARYFKDSYRLAVLLPFMAGDSLLSPANRTASWATDFYLGFKIAFQEIGPAGSRFEVDVYDTKGSDQRIDQLIRQGHLETYDVLVGPYRSQHASQLADFVQDKPVLLFSPYSASNRLGIGNPHYLQVNPGLETHLTNIFEDLAARQSEGDHVVFLYGDGDVEQSKKAFWDSLVMTMPRRLRSGWETRHLKASDIHMAALPIDTLLPGDGQHLVVLPSWEENMVMGVLRKLAAERLEKRIRVYGLPQWITFDRLDPAHLEALQVHVSSADYFDPRDPEMQALGKKYREIFGQPLNADVVWGYRSGRFLRQTLTREGALFQRFFPSEPQKPELGDLRFLRVPTGEAGHYRSENRQVYMLRFERGGFVPVR
jgi:hypothetical protein